MHWSRQPELQIASWLASGRQEGVRYCATFCITSPTNCIPLSLLIRRLPPNSGVLYQEYHLLIIIRRFIERTSKRRCCIGVCTNSEGFKFNLVDIGRERHIR